VPGRKDRIFISKIKREERHQGNIRVRRQE
jgi:hypothetical protein